jgi:adenine deaminase
MILNHRLFLVAKGEAYADLAVVNGLLVNVYSGEIYPGGVAVSGDTIAAVGDIAYAIGPETKVIDALGKYITPGFIDGHIHPESTSLSIRPFAEIVLAHGTTAIFTDLHEVGVVGGLAAIEAVLDEAKETDLAIYFVVPSHVPFSPYFETSGGHFDTEIIKKALARPDAVGLSECVGPYIAMGFPDLMASMDYTLSQGKSLQGHLPEMHGPLFNLCAAAGVSTDHEALSGEDALLRLRGGMHLMMREGSAARSLKGLLAPILENKLDTSRVSIVTDDLHTVDAVERGHLDDAVRTALSEGASFMQAIQFVTLNAARAFSLDHKIGGLAPGRRADINLTTGPEDFTVKSVIAGGRLVVEDGQTLVHYPAAAHAPVLLGTVHLKKPVTPEDFEVRIAGDGSKARVLVMDTLPWIPITQGREVVLPVQDGVVQCDLTQDALYIAQVERYGINGNIGKAFMGGFNLKAGAIASSVGHDNHNIIVLGTNHADMALAVNRVAELQGGQVVVKDGEVTGEIAYPVLGLLTDLSAEEAAAKKKELNAQIHAMGSMIPIPFMFLSFISLAAIPEYAVTDHGFIDVLNQKIIDPVLEILTEGV